MAKGEYTVTTGADGTRYLHLFGANGDRVTMSLDRTDLEFEEDGFAIAIYEGDGLRFLSWSADAFETVLGVLGDPATLRQSVANSTDNSKGSER